ncbi:MAG: hypothetical protein HFG54_09950 [Lachnospiraceae bacterium]|jgi:hypothetical protein|nr:hypothetical protein [Lachnospiraceae bacterium]
MDIQSTAVFRPEKFASPASSKAQIRKSTKSQAPASSAPFGTHMITGSDKDLYFKGEISTEGTLQTIDPALLEKDGIDWDSIERCYAKPVTLQNADRLEAAADHIASIYVAAKHTIQKKYAAQEDKLTENMNRLDALLSHAKARMASSYKNTVGRFLDSTGNKGLGEAMGNSLPSIIDQKIDHMETYAQQEGLFEKDLDYEFLELTLQVRALNAREKGESIVSQEDKNTDPEKNQGGYTIKDLQAAGFMAKTASIMNPNELLLMDNGQLGLHLAIRYMKMAQVMNHSGISEELSSKFLGSFETFLNQYSGGRLTGEKSASAPFSYAIKQYYSTKDIQKAMTQSAAKYLGDGFFSDFHPYGGDIRMSMSTRYNLELSQFMDALKNTTLQSF